jgi:hypothetical protein
MLHDVVMIFVVIGIEQYGQCSLRRLSVLEDLLDDGLEWRSGGVLRPRGQLGTWRSSQAPLCRKTRLLCNSGWLATFGLDDKVLQMIYNYHEYQWHHERERPGYQHLGPDSISAASQWLSVPLNYCRPPASCMHVGLSNTHSTERLQAISQPRRRHRNHAPPRPPHLCPDGGQSHDASGLRHGEKCNTACSRCSVVAVAGAKRLR